MNHRSMNQDHHPRPSQPARIPTRIQAADRPMPRGHVLAAAFLALGIVIVLACVTQVRGDDTAPASPTLDAPALEDTAATFAQASGYQATIDLKLAGTQGNWKEARTAEARVWFDREADHLAVDMPGAKLSAKSGKLTVTFTDLTDHHIERSIATPVSYEQIAAAVPELAGMIPAQVALLTHAPADDVTVTTAPRNRLTLHQPVDASFVGAPMQMTASYTPRNESFAAPVVFAGFSQDVTSSTGHASFADLRDALMAEQQQAAANGNGNAPQAMDTRDLNGKDAPELILRALNGQVFKLSKHPDQVVILDFWATWCPPCRKGLPKLESIHKWAQQENLPVHVLPVNVKEDPNTVKQFWDANGFTMHTLMDTKGQAAKAYRVRAYPTTVIVYKGKVQEVYIGLGPNLEQDLKDQIKELTKDAEKASVSSPLE